MTDKGEFTMDTETTQQLTKEEKDFYTANQAFFDDNGADIAIIRRGYEISLRQGLKPDEWKDILIKEIASSNAEQKGENSNDSTPEQEGENANGSTSIDEGQGNAPEPSSNAVEEEWMTDLLTKYKAEYNIDPNDESKNKYTIESEPNDDGFLITIEPKERQEGLTGSAVQYYDGTDHFAIRTSKDNVEPKDQSFEHFKHHIAVAKANGSSEITMGNTSSAKFRSKLAAAVFETEGMSLSTPLKDSDSFDFSKESLEGISPETQGKLLKFALENGAAIENPILDFNNEAVKNLPEDLKYKYLAKLLQNPETKAQLKNVPEVDLNKKDSQGQYITNKKASKHFIATDTDKEILYLQANDEGELNITEKDGHHYATVLDANGNPTDKNLLLEKVGDKYTYTVAPSNAPMRKYNVKTVVALEKYTKDDGFSTEDLNALAQYRHEQRQQKLAQLKEQTNDDGSKKYDFHDKVTALRNQIKGKTGDERKDIINNANVTEQTHGKNFAAYADKYRNPQGRS